MENIVCEGCGGSNAEFDLVCGVCGKTLPSLSQDGLARNYDEVAGPLPFTLPHRMDRHELIRLVGRGGMGVVYQARDLRLDRFVALKILNPENLRRDQNIRRLWREARSAARLNHPHIVITHDVVTESPWPHITMEWVDGENLDDCLPPSGMAAARVIKLGTQMLDALAMAHEHGVIHRDIKPANIMITREDRVKLLDFGMAKLKRMGSDHLPLSSTTGHGLFRGTPAYMSPEQIRGEPVDARSDIFSLGVVLYQMATGRHPFHGTNEAVVLHHICQTEPADPREAQPGLPDHLAGALLHALVKAPADRFVTAREFLAALS